MGGLLNEDTERNTAAPLYYFTIQTMHAHQHAMNHHITPHRALSMGGAVVSDAASRPKAPLTSRP